MPKTLAERRQALPPDLQPLLTQKQLEAYFGVSDWAVNQWVRDGCPVERLPNGHRRFDLSEVNEWRREQADGAAEATAEKSANALAART